MDRATALKLAPIFRKISIVLLLLTFASWALPYFNYDADKEFGIDISKGPLRFVPEDGAYYDEAKGEYVGEYRVVNTYYRGTDTLKTKDGKNEVHDYQNIISLWGFVLKTYNYPQILAKINYTSAKPADAFYHSRFYTPEGQMRPWKSIKIADMDHAYVNTSPRFIKMWFIAVTLYQTLFGAIGLLLCWKKRGIMTQVFPFLFGIIGIVGYFTNRILLMYSYPGVYALHIVLTALVLVNAIVGIIMQAFEIKTRPDEYYLPMI